MRIFSMQGYSTNSTAFKGFTKYFVEHRNQKFLTDYKPVYGCEGSEEFAKLEHPNPNPEVEKTLGAFRATPAKTVYWADPLENVSDRIKSEHDYVVYDHEPSYPKVNEEVSKRYFADERHDFGEDFAHVRDYYYRLQMADDRNFDRWRIPADQYQQWQAAECLNIYQQAEPLLKEKDSQHDTIKSLATRLEGLPQEIEENDKKLRILSVVKAESEDNVKLIKEKENLRTRVEELATNKENGEYAQILMAREYEVFKQTKNSDEKYLKNELEKIKNIEEEIKKCEIAKIELPKLFDSIPVSIKACEAKIADLKAQLIPHFDKLKNFYAKQGIRIIGH